MISFPWADVDVGGVQEEEGQRVQGVQPGAVSKAAGDQLNAALGASLSDLAQDQEVSTFFSPCTRSKTFQDEPDNDMLQYKRRQMSIGVPTLLPGQELGHSAMPSHCKQCLQTMH